MTTQHRLFDLSKIASEAAAFFLATSKVSDLKRRAAKLSPSSLWKLYRAVSLLPSK